MENDKDTKLIYNFLLEENLDAFLSSIRNQLHVYKVVDLTHVTRKDLSRIGILSGPDIRRFEKVVTRVTKSEGIKGKFTKVLGKKQKLKDFEIPPTISLWEDFAPVIIKTEDLELKEILGEGNFGQVHKADWTKRVAGHDCVIPVAVKCLKEDSDKAFMKEVSILSQLDQKHDNIIKLYGLSIHEDSLRMVTEFAEGGSLLDGLRNGEFILVSLLCQFAVQIASGMTYLEQKGLVHRDLAARNILVTAHNQVKVSDFGLSRLVGKDKEWVMTQEEVLPIRWLALESLTEGKFTSASDVWSFGVVLWEMFTFGDHPWKGFKSLEVVEKIKNRERLQEPDYCPSKIYSLVMLRCWTENPDERLNFEDAKSCLVSVHPTSSIAMGAQHYLDELQYSEGDCITAIKPFEGTPDVWIGQNETTNALGRFIKSQTSPMQCKIPYALTSLLNPGHEELSGHELPSGHDVPDTPAPLQNGSHDRSQAAPIPSAQPDQKLILKKTRSGSVQYDPVIAKPAQRRSSEATVAVQGSSGRIQSNEDLTSMAAGEEQGDPGVRPSSLPLQDRLAAGTLQRYPSCYMKMQQEETAAATTTQSDSHNETTKTEISPREQKSPMEQGSPMEHRGPMKQRSPMEQIGPMEQRGPMEQESPMEQSVKPKVPPRTDRNKDHLKDVTNWERHNPSSAGSGLNQRPVPANRHIQKKQAPAKPPRLHLYDVPMNNSGVAEPENQSSEFVIDPAAWMADSAASQASYYDSLWTASSSMSRQISRSEQDLFGAANTTVSEINSVARLNDCETKKVSSEKRRLRKTQSLESVSRLPVQQEIVMPLLEDRSRSKSSQPALADVPKEDSFELESGEDSIFDSSADSVSYKKLEDEGGKKKTLFGIRKKKKQKKESLKYPLTLETQNGHIATILQQLPGFSEPEVYGALEISRWIVDDAIKFLKVKKLVNLGLCPQASCLQMLKTYNWNELEASYAIKIHYIMAIHIEVSLDEASKLLRENQWDVNLVLNMIKKRSYFEECQLIGFSTAEAEHTLSFLGNSVDDATRALKVRRVADVTQKPEDYCQRTLEHCQWNVERAIHYIV